MATVTKLIERRQFADALRAARQQVAEDVTSAFLDRHPDWLERYGDRARQFGIQDACFHIDYLAAAIEAASNESFAGYARWAAGMLNTRGIAPTFLAENLEQIGEAVAQRVPGANVMVADFIQSARKTCLEPLADSAGRSPGDALSTLQRAFLDAILLGQKQAAVTILLEAVRSGHAILELYVRVIQESLYEVGRRWERNRITVAEEHMATAITQYAIARLYPLIPPAAESRGRAVITGIEGELHQVGGNLVADALEADGWDVVFLGANTPTTSILRLVEKHRPAVLGVSLTMLFNVPALIGLVDRVRELDGSVRIVAGGAAVRSAPGLCGELGIDGCAQDVQTGVRLFRTMA